MALTPDQNPGQRDLNLGSNPDPGLNQDSGLDPGPVLHSTDVALFLGSHPTLDLGGCHAYLIRAETADDKIWMLALWMLAWTNI